MMMVCIADANAAMGRGVSFSFVTTAEALDAEPEDCRIEGPVEITGEILCTGEAYRLTGCVRCERKAVCDRCLEHFSAEESYAFDEEVRRTDDESGLSIVDDKMDISPRIRDTLLAAQPIHNVGRIVSGFARNVVQTSMRVSAAVTVLCLIRGLRLWSSF